MINLIIVACTSTVDPDTCRSFDPGMAFRTYRECQMAEIRLLLDPDVDGIVDRLMGAKAPVKATICLTGDEMKKLEPIGFSYPDPISG